MAARAQLCFMPADPGSGEGPLRTAPILVEPSWEELQERARGLQGHQLQALLRSCLPD